MATKMKMVKKAGKMVPAFAADGKGKMMMGGSKPKAMYGASMTPAMMQSEMKKGGMVKKPASKKMMMGGDSKYQNGGPVAARNRAMGKKEPSLKRTLEYVKKNGSGYIPSNSATQKPNTESYKSAGTSIKNTKKPNTLYKAGSSATKYQDGGVTRKDIQNAKMEAKLNRIKSGTEPSGYEKVSNIAGSVAKTAAAAAEGARAVRDVKAGMSGPGGMKKGGVVKKHQMGGNIDKKLELSVRKNYTNNSKAILLGAGKQKAKPKGKI